MLIRSSILTGRHIFIYFAFISETSATYCRLCSAVLVLTVALCLEQWIYSQNYNTGRCNLRIYLSKQLLRMGQKSPFTPSFFSFVNKKRVPLYSLFCLHKRKYPGIRSLTLHKVKCVLRQKKRTVTTNVFCFCRLLKEQDTMLSWSASFEPGLIPRTVSKVVKDMWVVLWKSCAKIWEDGSRMNKNLVYSDEGSENPFLVSEAEQVLPYKKLQNLSILQS